MTEKTYRPGVCNICGSTRFRQVHDFKEWNISRDPVKEVAIVKCRSCGVRRRMPEILDDYEAQYHAPYVEQGAAIHPHQLSHFADLMTARLRRFDEKNLKFLDVGCSTGRALQLAKTMGFEATGLDFSRWAVEHCAQLGFATRHGSLIGQWPDAAQFDIRHCSHTIERVPDPLAYFQEMHRLLKPGGHLMLACPNYASLPRLTEGERWIWCLDSHLWQFTARQLKKMLGAQGFEIVSVRTLHGWTPNQRLKKWVLDFAAVLGWGDGLNLIARRP